MSDIELATLFFAGGLFIGWIITLDRRGDE
jgi:hypothetical protein